MIPARDDLLLSVGMSFGIESAIYEITVGGSPLNLAGCEVSFRGFAPGLGEIFTWKRSAGKVLVVDATGEVTPVVAGADTLAVWNIQSLKRQPAPPHQGMPVVKVGTWSLDIVGPGIDLRPYQGDLLFIPTTL